ncbi:SusC/RagA family TonB-linked outer membrane protein [Hymenobacter jeollabukensis]|uniref:TonB-dependent receptor n=1 Tax=Hymenobacter jeollabukensis TaxID=2025313 RepID=A0A5R8WQM3_9BACT|nr:TonB-dependent receptor [Hymenobacter jeollabukensis]TLM93054.1 TonB-dependent receptor [Hymenobacter jeollabukensis]
MRQGLLLSAALAVTSATLAQAQQTRPISGRVLDATSGEGLPGVTVIVKGTSIGASTNGQGEFQLTAPAGDVQLVLSYVGYLTETVSATGTDNVTVRLRTDQKALDEVVVIGYGAVKRSDVTGAIVSVKEEDLKKVPTANVMESLQGRLPGVDITRSSGSASSGVNVTVRGNRSLTANNGPLFIVDGIQYNSIQDINPNDIQSMEVLKDAASTAVYGSRGANGVIIVTTKKGAAGKTTVSFNTYVGQTEVQYYPYVNDGPAYVAQKREANRRDALRPNGLWSSEADDSKIFTPQQLTAIQNGTWTRWPDEFLRKGNQQEHQIGLAGGGDKTKFYLSASYYKEQGIFRMDNLKRYATRFNLEQAITDKIKVGMQNQLTYYNQNNRRDPLNIANKIDPLGAARDETGEVIVFPNNGKDINPLADELANNYLNNTRTIRTFLTGYASYQILPALSLRSNVGLTLGSLRTGTYFGSNTVDRNGSVPLASYGTQMDTNWSWENILNFTKTFGDHSLTATGVTSLLTFKTEQAKAQGANQLLSYQGFSALGNANQQVVINSGYVASNLVSFTGRVQYGYKGRYLLTLTGREDGSSKLPGNPWAFFPSAAVAWRLIDENFVKGLPVLSDLKLRASYGLAGNYDIAAYSSQTPLSKVPFSYGETSAPGYYLGARLGNTNLQWETSRTANVGLDFGLIRNRLTGSIDVYNTHAEKLLIDAFLPMTSGQSFSTRNVGETRNRGIEVGVNGSIIDNGKLRWNVGVSWFKNQEEILALSTGANDINNGWFIGSPTRVFYDYEKIGIWQTSEADEALKYGQKPGQIKVKDQNGDGKISATDDRVIIGSALPKWNGSLSSDLSYAGFDLSFQWFARIGQTINYEYDQIFDPQGIENSSRQDYWTPENPTNAYPRPDASVSKSSMQYFSTLAYRNGSYVKLRAATLGYNLPTTWLGKIGIGTARLYVQGKNLWVISKIKDYDPERAAAAAASNPDSGATTSTTAPAGARVGLAPLSNPIPRVVTVGLNLSF